MNALSGLAELLTSRSLITVLDEQARGVEGEQAGELLYWSTDSNGQLVTTDSMTSYPVGACKFIPAVKAVTRALQPLSLPMSSQNMFIINRPTKAEH